jgi:hypothetical protein
MKAGVKFRLGRCVRPVIVKLVFADLDPVTPSSQMDTVSWVRPDSQELLGMEDDTAAMMTQVGILGCIYFNH